MAEHDVTVTMPTVDVGKSDYVFAVHANGRSLGRLTVSRGGVGWHPAGPSDERHFRWEDFAKLVQRELG